MATKFFNKSATEGGQLYWPSNIAEQFDYLEMEILRYSQRNTRLKDLASRGGVTPIATPAASTTGSTSTQTISSRLPEISTTQLIPKGKILLPVPDNVSYTDGPQWSDQSVGAIGRFGAQAIADMMGGAGPEAVSDSLAQAAEVGKVDVIKGALAKIGVDPNALSQNIAGRIANPYLQQVFQGVGMRQFDFNWKLVPRNEGEQKSIHNIIKILRANVLPGFSNDFNPDQASNSSIGDLLSPNLDNNPGFAGKQNVDRWLTLPNIFNLKWKYEGGEIDSLPKLKQCVCKNISVQYTPDGVWATRMMDGKPQPIAYNLTMSFGEMSIVTNEDVITKGF
jgi:hypothetical protein